MGIALAPPSLLLCPRTRLLALGTLAALVGALPAYGQAAATRLRAVEVTQVGTAIVVSVEADGPLPEPSIGDAQGPPRVFLDFAGVYPATRGAAGVSGSVVRRVRVALNQANPLVTRVVVDLTAVASPRIEMEGRASGRLRLVFDSLGGEGPPPAGHVSPPDPAPLLLPAGSPPIPPVPELLRAAPASPPAPDPTTTIPPKPPASKAAGNPGRGIPPPPAPTSTTGTQRVPAADLERYRTQVGAHLDRLRGLRALLTAIDQQEARMPGGLTEIRGELSGILRALNAVRPPATLTATHDLLVRSASLGLMAITLRDTPTDSAVDRDMLRNASSASAGALLLLDRVCNEVGCGAVNVR